MFVSIIGECGFYNLIKYKMMYETVAALAVLYTNRTSLFLYRWRSGDYLRLEEKTMPVFV